MGFVFTGRVIFAQPSTLVGRLIIKISNSAFREQGFAANLVQLIQVIIQLRHQLLTRDGANIRHDKDVVQEAGNHGRMVYGDKPPGWMRAALGV
ncbi:hypothetical protein RCH14_004822 [Massilia sp. MP_M2]